MITANSFMKREFGKKLIEEFFVGDRSHPRHRHFWGLHSWTRDAGRHPVWAKPQTGRSRC